MKNKPDAILSADIHLREDTPQCRTDEYWEAQARKIKWLREQQEKYDCPILDAGDLLNKHRVSPYLEQWAIKNLPNDFITIPGNHDLPNHNLSLFEKSSLAVIETSDKITVLKNDIHNFASNYIHIFGVEYGGKLRFNTFRKEVKKILLLHTMCYLDKPPYPGAEREGGNAKSILKKYPDFDLIVTGHNHQSFIEHHKGRWLVNPGSMMRMSAEQINHKPCIYLWYAEKNEVQSIEYPFEKGVISREHLQKKEERDSRIGAFVEKLKGDIEISASFQRNMEKYLKKNKVKKAVSDLVWEMIDG